jgi:hypothetical protein
MFRIEPNPTFDAEVRITVPGSAEPALLAVTFRHRGRRELKAWIDRAKDAASDTAYLGEVIASWRGVEDADGRALPYSAEALARLLDAYPASGGELFDAYLDALTRAREKK